MKKVIYVFVVCAILVSITYYGYTHPEFANNIVKSIYEWYEEKYGEKLPEYNSEFVINSLVEKSDIYYYNTLTDNQKKIYVSVANAVKNLNTNFELIGYEYIDEETASKDIEVGVYKFLLDHPEVFYTNDKYMISTTTNIFGTKINLILEYLVSSHEELNYKISEVNKNIDKVLSNVKDRNSEFYTELGIHDYIAKNTKYYDYENIDDIPINCHNIYGTLVENSAVCDGFAKSMKLILNRCGIESIVVTGDLKNESHAWNLVKINNNWYNLDLTSNKSIKNDVNSYVIHSYFNITDELLSKSHTFDEKEILPKCESTEMYYYIVKNKVINSTDVFQYKFTEILNNSKNDELLEFSTDVINVPDKISTELSYRHYNSEYVDKNSSRFSYYNVLNTYVLLKLR
jgi:hypothetical protein